MKRTFLSSLLLLAAAFLLAAPLQAARFIPRSDLIPTVLYKIKSSYVDQNRVDPMIMLEGSLERLSAMIIPVMTEMNQTKKSVKIKVRVDRFEKELTFDKPRSVTELNEILQTVAQLTKEHLDSEEKPETVDYALINGFLSKLDPHTMLLVPDVYTEFSANTSGNFGGVGMMIGIRDGNLTVISPIDGTPASRAGLRAKDRIVQINDESTVNLPLNEAVGKLRGEIGTKVTIYIMRDGLTAPKEVEIVRDLIRITSVESHAFKTDQGRVGYIKLKAFQKNSLDQLNEHLMDLDYDLQDFQGLILDLRNNPGGLLDQAIRISDRFLDGGVIVATSGLDKSSIDKVPASWFNTIKRMPLIVLINNGSASASEIVAAALKANGRALVLGDQSFGKGSVQEVIEYDDTGLKFTKAKYLTPGERSIQSVGVTPHIKVLPLYVSEDFVRLTPPSHERNEHSLEQNFAEWGDKPEDPERTAFYLNGTLSEEQEDELESLGPEEALKKRLEEDYLVGVAKDILLKNQREGYKKLFDRGSLDHLLKLGHEYFAEEAKKQDERIVERFAKLQVDWSQGESAAKAKLVSRVWVERKDDQGKYHKHEGPVPAGSELRLHLEVTNQNGVEVRRLLAITESENGLLDERQLAFGRLEPKGTKSWFLPIQVAKATPSRNDLIRFTLQDGKKREIAHATYELEIQETKRPHMTYQVALSKKPAEIRAGQSLSLELEVKNQGKGASGPLTLLIKNGEGERIFLKTGRKTLEGLKPGQSGKASFSFDLKALPLDGDLDFSLDVMDGTYPIHSLNHKLKLPLKGERQSWQNSAPKVSLADTNLTSAKRKVTLKGLIEDDQGIKDVMVVLGDKKVYYQSYADRADRKKVPLEVELELTEEVNRVLVLSRDDQLVDGRKIFYLRKD